jgi:hypothetical protein
VEVDPRVGRVPAFDAGRRVAFVIQFRTRLRIANERLIDLQVVPLQENAAAEIRTHFDILPFVSVDSIVCTPVFQSGCALTSNTLASASLPLFYLFLQYLLEHLIFFTILLSIDVQHIAAMSAPRRSSVLHPPFHVFLNFH